MNKIITTALVATSVIFAATTASALTLKKGQVLGGDGIVYDGASPTQRAALIANAKRTGTFGQDPKTSGVSSSNVFIVVGDDVVFVPISDVSGKSKDIVKDIIVEAVETQFVLNFALEQAAGENLTPEQTEVLIAVLADEFDPEELDASQEEIAQALGSLDITEATRAATEAAWEGISQADLAEATAYAAERIANDNAIQDAIDQAAASGEEVDWEALQQQYPDSIEQGEHCDSDC